MCNFLPTIIRYYNVIFLFTLKSEAEKQYFDIYRKNIEGRPVTMMEIAAWCTHHGIRYVTKYYWRKDFSFTANLWNLYSYIRFRWESRNMVPSRKG